MCILIKGLPQPHNWIIIFLSPLPSFCPSPHVLVTPFFPITHPHPHASGLCVLYCLLHAAQRGLVHSKASQSGFSDFAACADATVCVCVWGAGLTSPPGTPDQHFIILQTQNKKAQSPRLLFCCFSSSKHTQCFVYFLNEPNILAICLDIKHFLRDGDHGNCFYDSY